MAKFSGVIGFGTTKEVTPGVHKEVFTEKQYTGDVLRNARRYQQTADINDDISVNAEISIISDTYLMEHFIFIKYVRYMGVNWKVTNIDVGYPRLTLTLGGVYNGKQASTA